MSLRDKYAYAISTAKGKFDGSAQERDGKLHFVRVVVRVAGIARGPRRDRPRRPPALRLVPEALQRGHEYLHLATTWKGPSLPLARVR